MPSALSVDLRQRVVAAVEDGSSRRQAANRFDVSPTSAIRWYERFAQVGQVALKPMGGDQRSQKIDAQADLIVLTYEAKLEIFLTELQEKLAKCGLRVGVSSLSRFFKRHGVTCKKHRLRDRAGSGGREGRPRGVARRPARSRPGRPRVPGRDRGQHQHGPPLRVRAARRTLPGRRSVRTLEGHDCHRRPAHQRPGRYALLDGATNGQRIRTYVEETLAPVLRQGDTVILDNLPAHKVKGVREAIKAAAR